MGTIYKQMVTRPLPQNAEIESRRRRATAKDLRSNPDVATVTEQVATWRDRKGRKRSAVVVTRTDGTQGVRSQTATYYASFRDGTGLLQEAPTGCRDKQAAMSVLNDLMNRAQLVKANVMSSDQARIADFQLVPLNHHISGYMSYLSERKVHPDRVKTSEARLTESSDGCGFKNLCDLNADALSKWLSLQMDGDREMSAAVFNGYVQIWVSFGNWCVGKRMVGKRASMNGDKRLIANPFDGMGKLDERSDQRRKARALSEIELGLLLDAARRRPIEDATTVRTGMRKGERTANVSVERRFELDCLGMERALIYKTAILTGLRHNELQTLKVGDVSFGDVPFIKLQRNNEKSRRGSTVPLRSDLAKDLQEWCKGKEVSELVFYVPTGLLKIMNRDLKTAGIPKVDSEGFIVHVHALRHSFGTHLSLAGVAPRVAQAAMRHSNISLTMNTYTDARLLDTSAAVESLPSFPLAPRMVTPTVTPAPVKSCHLGATSDTLDSDSHSTVIRKNPAIPLGITGFSQIGPAGFEPTTSTTPSYRYPEFDQVFSRIIQSYTASS